jgi:4-methylaminobutanoate oxidase (formaldehyde-forming)
MPRGLDAAVADVTEAYGVLSLMGPRSRDVLARISEDDLADKSFPYMTAREITVAGVAVRALRVTYVGELGWELHAERDDLPRVYDALIAAGESQGIADAGYRAIESLRLEKGYCAWGAELTPSTTPLEAGLDWAVKLDGEIPFLGRDALLERLDRAPAKRLACLVVANPEIVLLGRETIYRGGESVGWLTSGGWGYTVGLNLGYGYVRRPDGVSQSWLETGDYALDVAGRRVPAELCRGALYDPGGAKIRS